MLFTYDRLEIAKKTLHSLYNLHSPEEIWLHIADDGSSQEYRDELFTVGHVLFSDRVSISNSERGGYGASYNLATQATHLIADLLLPLEDDWELMRPLDLSPMVELLRRGEANCVRLGYVGWTQRLRSWFFGSGGYTWLQLDPDSEERHVFAGGPRLETRDFERSIGPWPEGEFAGWTEHIVAGKPESRQGVVWPADLIKPSGDAFVHIGSVPIKDAPLRKVAIES